MALGQKKRWAAIKGKTESPSLVTPEPTKPKRELSAAGKAAIVAALKKRWAAKKAETARVKPPVAKKAVKKAVVKTRKAAVKAKGKAKRVVRKAAKKVARKGARRGRRR